jgi:hypothetical protein
MYGEVRKMKNYLKIFLHNKLGRFSTNKCWILPFSVYIYNTGLISFSIYRDYNIFYILIYNLAMIISWGNWNE